MHPGVVIVSLWIGFWLSWLAAAPWSTPVEKGVGIKGELPYRIALVLGGLILLVPAHGYRGPLRLWLVTRGYEGYRRRVPMLLPLARLPRSSDATP